LSELWLITIDSKMPYYHVYIGLKVGEKYQSKYELDMSKETLQRTIVEPYIARKSFMCGGRIVNPLQIHTIRIAETKEPSSNVLPKIRRNPRYRESIIPSEYLLVAEVGINVTNKFFAKLQETQNRIPIRTSIALSNNVFIVHGRDLKPMKELETMLSKFGLNPIVLHEQPSGSRTIVEKLEKYSDVGYAFVILTPDDATLSNFGILANKIMTECKGKSSPSMPLETLLPMMKKQARQNVVLEFGYFMSLLTRDRVCCLYKGNVELPSDMHGIVYIPFKESVNEVRAKIVKELKAAGYEIMGK